MLESHHKVTPRAAIAQKLSGVGRLNAPWLAKQVGRDVITVTARIERALDPCGILNHGLQARLRPHREADHHLAGATAGSSGTARPSTSVAAMKRSGRTATTRTPLSSNHGSSIRAVSTHVSGPDACALAGLTVT